MASDSPLGRKITRLAAGADISDISTRDQRESRRLEFNRSLKEECVERNNDFLDRMMELMGDGARRVAEDAIDQSDAFWRGELGRVEEAHGLAMKLREEEVRGMAMEHERELVQAEEQVSDTVQTYNRAVADLTAQVTDLKARLIKQEAREEARCLELTGLLESQERREEERVARLTREIQGSEETLESATRTFKGLLQDLNKQLHTAQVAAREGDLKAQQKRLLYGQTLSSQQRELEDTLTELDHTKALLEEQEARSRKLTALSQYLLAKHQQLVKSRPSSTSPSSSPPPDPPTPPNSHPKANEPDLASPTNDPSGPNDPPGPNDPCGPNDPPGPRGGDVGPTPSPADLTLDLFHDIASLAPPSGPRMEQGRERSGEEGEAVGEQKGHGLESSWDHIVPTHSPPCHQQRATESALFDHVAHQGAAWDPFNVESVDRLPSDPTGLLTANRGAGSGAEGGGWVVTPSPEPPARPQTDRKGSRQEVLKAEAEEEAEEEFSSPLRELEKMLGENLGGSCC